MTMTAKDFKINNDFLPLQQLASVLTTAVGCRLYYYENDENQWREETLEEAVRESAHAMDSVYECDLAGMLRVLSVTARVLRDERRERYNRQDKARHLAGLDEFAQHYTKLSRKGRRRVQHKMEVLVQLSSVGNRVKLRKVSIYASGHGVDLVYRRRLSVQRNHRKDVAAVHLLAKSLVTLAVDIAAYDVKKPRYTDLRNLACSSIEEEVPHLLGEDRAPMQYEMAHLDNMIDVLGWTLKGAKKLRAEAAQMHSVRAIKRQRGRPQLSEQALASIASAEGLSTESIATMEEYDSAHTS